MAVVGIQWQNTTLQYFCECCLLSSFEVRGGEVVAESVSDFRLYVIRDLIGIVSMVQFVYVTTGTPRPPPVAPRNICTGRFSRMKSFSDQMTEPSGL